MASKTILRWQIAGFFVLITIGALLHFTYRWSEFNPIVGLFSSVNESVWEHFKLGFTSLLLFSAVEYAFIGKGNNRYFLAKAIGIIALDLFIAVFFYIYTSFTGDDILILDIISFVIACAICQLAVYRILTDEHPIKAPNTVGISVISVFAALLFVFTFWPPQKPMFEDPNRHTYGTEWHVDPEDRTHDH